MPVSADGSVVVGIVWANGGPQAFRWTAPTGMQMLGDLPGGQATSAARNISAATNRAAIPSARVKSVRSTTAPAIAVATNAARSVRMCW